MTAKRFTWAAIALAMLPSSACAAGDSTGFFDGFDRFAGHRWYISNGWANGAWQDCSWTRHNVAVKEGRLILKLTPTKSRLRDNECAELQSRSRFGYGTFEGRMKAAKGSGIVSALFTYSGRPITSSHDELDFEVLGSRPDFVETTYFKNGRSNAPKRDPIARDQFVTYAVEWLPGSLRWFVDGKLVRTDRGAKLPQVAGKMYLSVWNVAASKKDWAGSTDRSKLPATVEFDWVAFTPSGRRCLFPQSITCTR